jgi:hypothetical protein
MAPSDSLPVLRDELQIVSAIPRLVVCVFQTPGELGLGLAKILFEVGEREGRKK